MGLGKRLAHLLRMVRIIRDLAHFMKYDNALGQHIDVWNQDGGTASEQSYKCVPFYLSTAGYGLFVRHSGEVEYEVGSEKVSRIAIAVRGESLEYYFIHGSNPVEVNAPINYST